MDTPALLLQPQCARWASGPSQTRGAWLDSCRRAARAGLHRLPEDAGRTCRTGTHSRQTWKGGSHPARAESVAGQLGSLRPLPAKTSARTEGHQKRGPAAAAVAAAVHGRQQQQQQPVSRVLSKQHTSNCSMKIATLKQHQSAHTGQRTLWELVRTAVSWTEGSITLML